MRLKEDLSPFAYELPTALSPHLALLKSLGAQDEPSAQVGFETNVSRLILFEEGGRQRLLKQMLWA